MAANNDSRIRQLEKDRAMVYGSAAVLAFVGSALMWFINHLFKG